MIKVIWDSFCRAIIRFWDNRFVKDDHNHYYEMEISRLRQINQDLQAKLLEIVLPNNRVQNDFVIDSDQKPLRAPIETTSQRRFRLERESREEWIRQVNEARAKLESSKTQVMETSDLEKSVGVAG